MSYRARGGSGYRGRSHRSNSHKGSRKSKPINILDYPYSTWALDRDGKEIYGRAFKSKKGAISKAESLAKDDSTGKVIVRSFKKGKLLKETNFKP